MMKTFTNYNIFHIFLMSLKNKVDWCGYKNYLQNWLQALFSYHHILFTNNNNSNYY
jgi:hypothetical protein